MSEVKSKSKKTIALCQWLRRCKQYLCEIFLVVCYKTALILLKFCFSSGKVSPFFKDELKAKNFGGCWCSTNSGSIFLTVNLFTFGFVQLVPDLLFLNVHITLVYLSYCLFILHVHSVLSTRYATWLLKFFIIGAVLPQLNLHSNRIIQVLCWNSR